MRTRWSFGNPLGKDCGENHSARSTSIVCGCTRAFARQRNRISTCRGFLNERLVKISSCSTSSAISSRSSRLTACSGCSPASRNPPGMPQPLPARKRCLSSSTWPASLKISAPAVTVKRVCVSRILQRRTRAGSARQILARNFCNTDSAYTVFDPRPSVQIRGQLRVQCASDAMAATDTITVPKRITNAQTVCSEKNQKGKLCNGHLKQLRTAGEPAQVHLRGDDVLFKCQTCGTLYMGPPLGHVRDPNKQVRFVEAELTALLQAAGGTLPVIKRDEARGVFVMVETEVGDHGAHAAKPALPQLRRPCCAESTGRSAGSNSKTRGPSSNACRTKSGRTQSPGLKPEPATVQTFDIRWRGRHRPSRRRDLRAEGRAPEGGVSRQRNSVPKKAVKPRQSRPPHRLSPQPNRCPCN